MKVIEVAPDYYRTHEMPKEFWDEVALLKICHPRFSLSELLARLPLSVRRLVKRGRKRLSIPNGIKLDAVCIDEVV